jgi:TPR repeat protein
LFCGALFPALAQPRGEFPPALTPESGVCHQLEALRATAATDPQAALQVAAALEFGACGPATPVAAAGLYEVAAAGGILDAGVRLAVLYSNWRGGLDNPLKADWEMRAIAAGALGEATPTVDPMPNAAAL